MKDELGATLEVGQALNREGTPELPKVRAYSVFILHPSAFILSITLLAAILRFTHLAAPPIWGDEAKTFMRACGSFQQLVDALATSDFAPLHYLLYWTIAQFTKLTPAVMRVPPAIAGTLMVPAMYWLAVQIVSRRVAMLVTLFTACSAFMLNYSRDAKMYAECWLFVTLSTASLLWFLRSRSRIAWYCWMICGIAMVGLQAVATIVLVVQALIFLSHRSLHWKPAIFFVAGLVVILGPLIAYTKYFNKYADRVENDGPISNGTQWVEPYNRGRDGFDLVRYAMTAYLYSWEWPRAVNEPQIRERTLKLLKAAGGLFGALLLLGVFPWRSSYRSIPDTSGESWWRGLFWISLWIALPLYGFYCASIKAHLSAWELLRSMVHAIPGHPLMTAGCAVAMTLSFYFCASTWKSRLLKTSFLLATLAILVGLLSIIHIYAPVQKGSVWIPRYIGTIWPAFAIAVCVLLCRLPSVQLRVIAISLLILVNLAQHAARVFAGAEPPTDLIVQDVLATQSPDSSGRVFYRIVYPAFGINFGEPGSGVLGTHVSRYYFSVLSGKPITPDQMRYPGWEQNFRVFTLLPFGADAFVATNVAQSPQLKRITVWDKLNPGQVEQTDALQQRLPAGWQRVSEDLYPARDHWTWRELFTAHRRTYEKMTNPETRNPNQ